ncbi:type-F conjugative transfer system pilin assembly protein TrbC [Glaesserella parasuis]|nr:type-F conjugative transfer system pilin assembly protein TrbC [Glaesserella parasuis 174]MCT8756556.1 type-F conjugative transfer system pilin assembly protein TrbC [Glaesserella parasuis]MDD2170371.1 type-F conjugative transfer system pilin assembly protein TrbC [Glaesserella parasuis]MDO9767935.1 type-F conjugative transfer system pilin assembly protein TrbC [Glaesserella parasuis]MDO9922510.1 type-F conjugative transfer system pilin assembly protein TrbC [Glaesserella parasuis]
MKKIAILLLMLLPAFCLAETEPTPPLDYNENEVAYFVSFSIPEPQLVALIKEAENHNIPIYIRGLVKNDMRATTKAMLYLATKYDVKGLLVDPVRFDYYGIEAVPALVKKCGSQFDVVFGNVNLAEALALIKLKGDCK